MKLLAKYNRINIPITIATLLISSIAYYFILHFVLLRQIDKDLRIEQEEIIHYVNEKGTLPEASNYKDQQIEFSPTQKKHFNANFSTESEYDEKEESQSFRKLEFFISADGKKLYSGGKKIASGNGRYNSNGSYNHIFGNHFFTSRVFYRQSLFISQIVEAV